MYSLGMDLGTSTVKIVLMQNGTVAKYWLAVHHGRPLLCLRQGLSELAIGRDETLAVCVTGDNAGALLERCPVLSELGEIPAIVEGVRRLVPQAGSIIEIGSQGARFITEVQSRTPQFAANEHCAGGTGSFFEDQMSRVGCKLEDYSALVEQAQSIPRLSGRCAVFAKTDIIHRQQEGVSTPDILLGLCYAMIHNYKATIVRRLPVCKPVVFCGGVTCNSGVIRAIRDVFDLTEEELIVPEEARFEAAIGAACKAEGAFTLAQLDALLNDAMATRSTTTGLPRLELLPGTDLSEPKATGILPEKGCALGIDIGSTSTDLVLVGPEGELVDFQYLRTAGDPEGAVRKGLASIRERFGAVRFTAVGVTGSGRERVGKRIGADAVRDEITAQAKGAAHWVPEVDTVFEIGGQDSKYISLKNGEVVDFQMNKICAAGTGSFVEEQAAEDSRSAETQRNIDFYRQADNLLLEGYTGKRDPRKKTVGVPFVLMIHKFFPMANAFFTSLGFNVVLTDPTSEETIRLSQQLAQSETCYPVKLIYGHIQQLIDQKVNYIFLPSIHTMKHEKSRVKHNYGCVYMQTAAVSIAKALDIESKGITLLSPVFDLDFGQEAMATAMLGLGKVLGIPKPLCAKALLSGAMAVRRHTAAVEKQGKALLATLKPEDKILVLITRNYGVSDPILNMGIPELLLERGYKVITLSHLPGHALDIADEYENLYYPFGQHILSGAKLIAHHPNLYAVYLTNHGCGPDTMLSHLFKQEMGDKPYLQIEVDEHFSNVGVITRIEAFLNSLNHRPVEVLPKDFVLEQVDIRPCHLPAVPEKDFPLWLPPLGEYTASLTGYFRAQGVDARALPHLSAHALSLGRAETSAKEYLPFPALLGGILAQQEVDPAPAQFLIPQTQGAEADGQYARVIRAVLDRRGNQSAKLVSPMLETLPATAQDRDALFRALLAGDILYAAPAAMRAGIAAAWDTLPGWAQLHKAAVEIGRCPATGRRLATVGTPLCLTELDSGVLSTLEAEGSQLLRAPLSEALWFLWKDNMDANKPCAKWLEQMAQEMQTIGAELGAHSTFAQDTAALFETADTILPHFAGGNGRYRYAKAVELSGRADAVLTLAPRYENAATILDMRGLRDACKAPLFQLSLDNDWDETAWSRLRSFLYYC